MATIGGRAKWVEISGESPRLVDLLSDAIGQALAGRSRFYVVSVDSIGRAGEVLVSITGSRGHVPLRFAASELEPANVTRVVEETVSRCGL